MLRKLAGAAAGLIVAFIVITGVEYGSGRLYPMPEGLDFNDKQAMKAWIDALPLTALLLVLAAYGLGAVAGGFTAATISKDRAWMPLAVGAVLLLLGFFNLSAIPHPFWFAAASTLIYIPAALIGARLARA